MKIKRKEERQMEMNSKEERVDKDKEERGEGGRR